MTTTFQESVCWMAAKPCPMPQTTAGRKLSCQAWFHCEKAGDYVIRWRCNTLEEEINFNDTAHFMCRNQSNSWQLAECPPPVVCPDDIYKVNSRMKSGTISTEITIVIALAAFALLSVILIVISCYKYWTLRKRYRTQEIQNARHHPRQYLFRDFRSPVPYHNMWGSGYQHYYYHGNKNSQLLKPHGSSYPDVYFSRPHEPWKYFEHLITSSDDSIANNTLQPRRLTHAYFNSNRVRLDPTVATESFIYHQPVKMTDVADLSSESDGWFYQNKRKDKESQDRDGSVERFHMYKGNIGRFRAHDQIYENRTGANSRKEFHHLVKSNSDFIRAQQVSSIPIPAFSINGVQETNTRSQSRDSEHQQRENHPSRLISRVNYDSDNSYGSLSHYAHGMVTKAHSSQHNNIVSSEIHHKSRHHSNLTPTRVKVHTATTTYTNRTSPDVINSHNFTNRFVRVGKNIYKPVLTKSPSASSMTLSSISNNYADVSYHSFLHEHLKELAKRGAASSSTLEAGHREEEEQDGTRIDNHRY